MQKLNLRIKMIYYQCIYQKIKNLKERICRKPLFKIIYKMLSIMLSIIILFKTNLV